MSHLKYYKRNGYEFQVIQRNGDVCRAVGKRKNSVIHQILRVGVIPATKEEHEIPMHTFSSEKQAVEKFAELVGDICPKCHDQRMMPSDDLDGDVMNTPCPLCNENSPDYGKQQ